MSLQPFISLFLQLRKFLRGQRIGKTESDKCRTSLRPVRKISTPSCHHCAHSAEKARRFHIAYSIIRVNSHLVDAVSPPRIEESTVPLPDAERSPRPRSPVDAMSPPRTEESAIPLPDAERTPRPLWARDQIRHARSGTSVFRRPLLREEVREPRRVCAFVEIPDRRDQRLD